MYPVLDSLGLLKTHLVEVLKMGGFRAYDFLDMYSARFAGVLRHLTHWVEIVKGFIANVAKKMIQMVLGWFRLVLFYVVAEAILMIFLGNGGLVVTVEDLD